MTSPLPSSRLRLASAVLALVSLGLLLSLLPRTSFVARSAGDIVDAVGPVWPKQSVEQVLDDGLGVVSEVRIWGAARVGRGEAPVVAALLQGPDRVLVRQDRVAIKASHLLQPYVLEFAPYHPVPGEALILQLWVSDERNRPAIFGTTEAGGEGGGPTFNLNPTDQGPLAYEVIWQGDGWRAALAGSRLDLARLAGGVAAAVVAVLLSPPVARRIRRALGRIHAAMLVVGRLIAAKLSLAWRWLAPRDRPGARSPRHRQIYVYPWLIPAFAILHYLVNNLFLLRPHEAIVPGAVIMAGVTVVFVGFRLLLKSAASAALLTGLLGMVFFSFGHIYVGPEEQPDSRYLLGIGVPVIGALLILLRRRSPWPHAIGRILNYGSGILLVAPLYQLGLVFVTTIMPPDAGVLREPIVIDERVTEARATLNPDDMPDIYYIILDAYPRNGSPPSFDNSEFVQALEDRGFYVDPQARSNYTSTIASTTSSSNMSYMDIIADRGEFPKQDIYQVNNAMLDHSLGDILTGLGYRYIHVSSGWFMTKTNRNADVVVDFTPAGTTESEYVEMDLFTYYPYTFENAVNPANFFMSYFLRTTFITYFDFYSLSCLVCLQSDVYAYNWTHPNLSLQWIDYMKNVGKSEGPKFVFAHFLKPHSPYSFDRFGNIAREVFPDGSTRFVEWSNEHDPEVDAALYGQVAWLNGQLLEIIDSILSASDHDPIVVITSDHGLIPGKGHVNENLGAYRLPDGGADAIYPGITSVNVFRMILNYYFDLGLSRLEDEVFITGPSES